jgi:GR25 family glycosyltransferase involved in LPS biosynthesis
LNGPAPARAIEQAAAGHAGLGIFAVNLDRSPERWAAIERHFGQLSWPLHRVAALDATKGADHVLAVRGLTLSSPPNGVGWNPYRQRMFALVEEACFASHLLAWRQFLDSGLERGLILEDDAEPFPGFEEAMARLLSEGAPIDIVKFEGIYRKGGRLAIPVRDLGAAKLVRSLRPCSGGAAYVLTRRSAQRLIETAGKLCLPVDDFIWSQGLHGCDLAHLSPWLIMQSGAASTMVTARTPNRHVKRRDPVNFLAQGVRRLGLRFSLWRNALQGSPLSLLAARQAPWCPAGFAKHDAPAARPAAVE